MTHDPLCGMYLSCNVCGNGSNKCTCRLIARVREDERGKFALRHRDRVAEAYQHGLEVGLDAALRDAVDAVMALYDRHDASCGDPRCEGPDREFAVAAIESLGGAS